MNDESHYGLSLVSWSGGKDAMMALQAIWPVCDQVMLFTIIENEHHTVNMHGVPLKLLQEQAQALGLPIDFITIEKSASDDSYQASVRKILTRYKEKQYMHVVYGDIFLEDLRNFKEKLTISAGLKAEFPLWNRPTQELAANFIDNGYKAIITSVDSRALDWSFVGKTYDREFLDSLPAGIDPCGEKGEFHTFVYDGPGFSSPVPFVIKGLGLYDRRFYQLDMEYATC